MKTLLKIIAVLFSLIMLFIVFVELTWDSPIDAPYPDIKASSDSTIIARGEYLVHGPAHCNHCHFSVERMDDVLKGVEVPLSGGLEFIFPPAVIRAQNITPDTDTGIGSMTDAEIARTLRYSIGFDSRYILPPFMPFQETSDEDLTAIVSYIRTIEPQKNKVKATEYTFLGKALLALGKLPVRDMAVSGPKSVQKDSTAEYGAYMATSVCNCLTCHTNIDVFTLERLGPEFSGGFYFEPDNNTGGFSFVSPNLTPDMETGHITQWSQQDFINRFKAGPVLKGTPMPWGAFKNMDETDLKAIYKFLTTLKPVQNRIEKTVYAPGEKYAAQ